MNKTAIHNIAIAILTLPVFILSVFKPIVKVFSKLSKIFYSQWKSKVHPCSRHDSRDRNTTLVHATK